MPGRGAPGGAPGTGAPAGASGGTAPGDFGGLVLELVADIPPGCVLSYGDVAAMLGSRAARAVGTVMARSGGTVPWWRVVRADGSPPVGHAERALPRYEDEGTLLRPGGPAGYRIDLAAARWRR
ncbi:MGMT family protein [Agromyces archimandritae]|uniref:MGMT family protein n=1 Tax=Agromyces archimandritae TaxID=2781962 RepID=A0A975IMV4_9MICO|nr:MGMT family protein [Agromyces archimandritae]QTX03923.1 MGMT family protein [Agromyces archimandritae]